MKLYALLILGFIFSKTTIAQQNTNPCCLKDSLCLVKFIRTNNICNKLSFAEQNILDIAAQTGFYYLLMSSISKESGQSIDFKIINGNAVATKENIAADLKVQFDAIKSKCKCN